MGNPETFSEADIAGDEVTRQEKQLLSLNIWLFSEQGLEEEVLTMLRVATMKSPELFSCPCWSCSEGRGEWQGSPIVTVPEMSSCDTHAVLHIIILIQILPGSPEGPTYTHSLSHDTSIPRCHSSWWIIPLLFRLTHTHIQEKEQNTFLSAPLYPRDATDRCVRLKSLLRNLQLDLFDAPKASLSQIVLTEAKWNFRTRQERGSPAFPRRLMDLSS